MLDTDAHANAIRAVLAGPASTSARFAPLPAAQNENTWELVAERGLYAFDADIDGGPYRLVAAPESAIDVSHLPEAAVDVIRVLTFSRLRFAGRTTLSEQDLRRGR